MTRLDRWVAGVLGGGVAGILLAILLAAWNTHIPVSHLYVDAAAGHQLLHEGIPVQAAPDWPGAYRVNARASNAAFTSQARLYFSQGPSVQIPRREVLLWVYR